MSSLNKISFIQNPDALYDIEPPQTRLQSKPGKFKKCRRTDSTVGKFRIGQNQKVLHVRQVETLHFHQVKKLFQDCPALKAIHIKKDH